MRQIITYRKHRIAVRYLFTTGIMAPTCLHLMDERLGAVNGYVFSNRHQAENRASDRTEYSIMPSNWFVLGKERVLKESLGR